MAKTTNILDLNNRLEKVEKENVSQNNYNSLKNRPKINGNLLTGDKTSAQLGLADAQDITDINDELTKLNAGNIRAYPIITSNNYAAVSLPKATTYTINNITLLGDPTPIPESTGSVTDGYTIFAKSEEDGYILILLVGSYASVNAGKALNLVINIQ